jgi:putative transposase
VPWSSWVCGPTAPRSWWRSRTATGSRRRAGPTCCGTSSAEGCGRRCWPWATVPSGSGVLCGRCFPATGTQRCWVHKVANLLSAMPASAQRSARRMLADIRDAEDRDHAVTAITALAEAYAAKYPKAVAKVVGDTETLLAFFDFPAEHWIHLKTTNPIESTFATVRLRAKVTKGPGSRAAGLAMAFKLIEAAQDRWRAVNGSHLVALVRAGAKFEKGVMVERPNEQDQEAAA